MARPQYTVEASVMARPQYTVVASVMARPQCTVEASVMALQPQLEDMASHLILLSLWPL